MFDPFLPAKIAPFYGPFRDARAIRAQLGDSLAELLQMDPAHARELERSRARLEEGPGNGHGQSRPCRNSMSFDAHP